MSIPIARVCAVLALQLLLCLPAGLSAQAGPGHDHGHGAASTTRSKAPANPRVTMVSDTYDLVGILVGHKLTLYLDRRRDTSPVTDAKINLIINGVAGAAVSQSDGSYLYENKDLEAHEKFEVVAEIIGTSEDDLLVGTLDGSQVHDAHGDDASFGHDHAIHHQDETGLGTHQTQPGDFLELLSGPSLIALGIGAILGFFLRPFLSVGRTAALVISIGIAGLLASPDTAYAGPGHKHHHKGGEHAHKSTAKDMPGRMDDGRIFIPKPTQRLLEIRTQILAQSTAKRSERLIGRVIADPNSNGLVQSSIRGRIKPAKGGLPVLGQAVKIGDTLALVEPAFAPIDASDVRQTAGDLEQRMAVLKARLARGSQLVRKNVASPASLQDIEIELEGLRMRRSQLDESRKNQKS